jgi:hypothetical protein
MASTVRMDALIYVKFCLVAPGKLNNSGGIATNGTNEEAIPTEVTEALYYHVCIFPS